MLFRSLVFVFLLTTVCSVSANGLSFEAQEWFRELVGLDLLLVQQQESFGSSVKDIEIKNKKSFELLNSYTPLPSKQRVEAVDYNFAHLVLESINKNPVVSEYSVDRYKNGPEIGFCFGRATYVHLVLLRAGVERTAIKKIWAVGPMRAGGLDWQFHVATIVKAKSGGWYVIDSFMGAIMTPNEWFLAMQKFSLDQKLRLYVSDPRKFSVSLGEYNRVQMGLDLSLEEDWYSHYFKDLMLWMSSTPLEKVDLYDLRDSKR